MFAPVVSLTPAIASALVGIFFMLIPIVPMYMQIEYQVSEDGTELLEDYKFVCEWFDKETEINYEEALNSMVEPEIEEFITPDSERLEIYIREDRHNQLNIDFNVLFRELPKEIKQEIKDEEVRKDKFKQEFHRENIIARKYIEWFYYGEG